MISRTEPMVSTQTDLITPVLNMGLKSSDSLLPLQLEGHLQLMVDRLPSTFKMIFRISQQS